MLYHMNPFLTRKNINFKCPENCLEISKKFLQRKFLVYKNWNIWHKNFICPSIKIVISSKLHAALNNKELLHLLLPR